MFFLNWERVHQMHKMIVSEYFDFLDTMYYNVLAVLVVFNIYRLLTLIHLHFNASVGQWVIDISGFGDSYRSHLPSLRASVEWVILGYGLHITRVTFSFKISASLSHLYNLDFTIDQIWKKKQEQMFVPIVNPNTVASGTILLKCESKFYSCHFDLNYFPAVWPKKGLWRKGYHVSLIDVEARLQRVAENKDKNLIWFLCKFWLICLFIWANICFVLRPTMDVSRAAIVESLLWPVPPKIAFVLQMILTLFLANKICKVLTHCANTIDFDCHLLY